MLLLSIDDGKLPRKYTALKFVELLNKLELILTRVLGNTIDLSFSQLLKAQGPMFVRPSGKTILVRLLHPEKAYALISLRFWGNINDVRPLQPENAAPPIFVIDAGIVTFFKSVAPVNKWLGILFKPFGRTTFVSFRHPRLVTFVTVFGIISPTGNVLVILFESCKKGPPELPPTSLTRRPFTDEGTETTPPGPTYRYTDVVPAIFL